MMDNQTKQCLASIEARVLRLERIIDASILGIQQASQFPATCSQCGIYTSLDPNNYTCSYVDCCQGLNPEDEK